MFVTLYKTNKISRITLIILMMRTRRGIHVFCTDKRSIVNTYTYTIFLDGTNCNFVLLTSESKSTVYQTQSNLFCSVLFCLVLLIITHNMNLCSKWVIFLCLACGIFFFWPRLAIMASERLLILQPHNWALRRDHGMMLYFSRYDDIILYICSVLFSTLYLFSQVFILFLFFMNV